MRTGVVRPGVTSVASLLVIGVLVAGVVGVPTASIVVSTYERWNLVNNVPVCEGASGLVISVTTAVVTAGPLIRIIAPAVSADLTTSCIIVSAADKNYQIAVTDAEQGTTTTWAPKSVIIGVGNVLTMINPSIYGLNVPQLTFETGFNGQEYYGTAFLPATDGDLNYKFWMILFRRWIKSAEATTYDASNPCARADQNDLDDEKAIAIFDHVVGYKATLPDDSHAKANCWPVPPLQIPNSETFCMPHEFDWSTHTNNDIYIMVVYKSYDCKGGTEVYRTPIGQGNDNLRGVPLPNPVDTGTKPQGQSYKLLRTKVELPGAEADTPEDVTPEAVVAYFAYEGGNYFANPIMWDQRVQLYWDQTVMMSDGTTKFDSLSGQYSVYKD